MKGFTLIELLVVVLIIGILAAIAVPQYQKAVERSRATQAITLLKSVAQAAESYYLANGTEFTSFDDLAVDIPWTGNTRVIGNSQDTRSNGEWALEIERSSNTIALFVTRLTGKYQGTGFNVHLSTDGTHYENPQFRCFERTAASTRIFDSSLPAGSYCEKIMRSTLLVNGAYSRSYHLP